MTGLILRRLAQAPLILLVIYTVTFLLAWALPGSAVIRDEGRAPPPEVLAAMEARYNLDNPVAFYFGYLRGVVTRFDFGPSLRYPDWTVNEILSGALPVSITLGLAAIVIALFIGSAAGVAGALRPGSALDAFTLTLALVGVSLPTFVIGAALLLVFPVWLGWGRVGAWQDASDALLPAFALSLPFAAYIARLTRMGMIEALDSDYVRTARAKGLPERTVILRHALPNAFLPTLSYLGPAAAAAMTGSFVVEKVFNIPGVGQHFVNGVLNKDLFLIMGVVLVYATILIAMNLVVDVLYRWVDPRIA
ncbi:MAG: ABC transporter permease [Phycisphaerales bacterium]|nr:ABC transporter permease [Phycisphaerales bacterium]